MSKSLIVEALIEETGLSAQACKNLYGKIGGLLVDECIRDGKIMVPNLGTLKIVFRKARVARNPKTGEKINVPSTHQLKLRPAVDVKTRLKELPPEV